MDYAIKSAIAELPNFIIARIIHKELVVSTMGAFSPLQVVIYSDVHLGGRHFAFAHLNSTATTNSINKWTAPLNLP